MDRLIEIIVDNRIILAFVVELIALIAIDQKVWGTYFTPITFLSIPFIIVYSSALILAPQLGFYAVHPEVLKIWSVGLFCFWLPGFIIGAARVKLIGFYQNPFVRIKRNISNNKLLINFSWLLVFVLYVRIGMLSRVYDISSADFTKALGQGIPAHFAFALRFILIYLIVIVNKKNFGVWLLIGAILLSSILYGAKSWIVIPLIAGVFTRLVLTKGRVKISIIRIIGIVIGVFLLFFVTYYLSVLPKMDGDMDSYVDFVFHHIARYFFSGIISLSEYIRNDNVYGLNLEYIYASPLNIYRVLIGDEIINTTSDLWNVITVNGFPSNVKTLFGTLYIYGGVRGGMLFSFFFGLLYYCFFLFVSFRKSPILLSVYAFLVTILIFGWFEMYFQLLAFYEVPIIGVLVHVFTKNELKMRTVDVR